MGFALRSLGENDSAQDNTEGTRERHDTTGSPEDTQGSAKDGTRWPRYSTQPIAQPQAQPLAQPLAQPIAPSS